MAPIIRVPLDDLRMIAQDIQTTGGQFIADAPPPVDPDPDWPSTQATNDFNHGVYATNQQFQQHSHDTGDKVRTSADAFQAVDENNAQALYSVGQQMGSSSSGLKPNEVSSIFTGIVKDIGTAASGIANSLLTGIASASGALGGAAATGLGTLSSAGANIGATMAKSNMDLHPPGASVGAGVGGAPESREKPAQTAPTAGVSPIGTPTSSSPEGGRPVTAQQEEQVVPAAMPGTMGMNGAPAGLLGAGGATSAGKSKTYKVATAHEEEDFVTAPIPIPVFTQISLPPIERAG